MTGFEQFARLRDPRCPCPQCGFACLFATNFKKFGEHEVRVCERCRTVFHNGKPESTLEVSK